MSVRITSAVVRSAFWLWVDTCGPLVLSASCEVHGRNVWCAAVKYRDSGTPQPPKGCAVTSTWILTFSWAISYILVVTSKFLLFLVEAQNSWVHCFHGMAFYCASFALGLRCCRKEQSHCRGCVLPLLRLACVLAQRSEAWGELVWWRMAVGVDGLQGCLSRVLLCLCYSGMEHVAGFDSLRIEGLF